MLSQTTSPPTRTAFTAPISGRSPGTARHTLRTLRSIRYCSGFWLRRQTAGRERSYAALLPAFSLLLLLTGCASAPHSDDIRHVIEVAIASVQSTEPFQIVAAAELPGEVRRTILSMRQAAPRNAVTANAEYSLLPGYMKVTAVDVDSDRARFVGILGPLPPPERRHVDCGMTYSIDLQRRDLVWVILKATVA